MLNWLPPITLGLIVVIVLAYLAGARYPGMAAKVGVA